MDTLASGYFLQHEAEYSQPIGKLMGQTGWLVCSYKNIAGIYSTFCPAGQARSPHQGCLPVVSSGVSAAV